MVGILVLIYGDKTEAFLVVVQDFRMLIKKIHGFHDEVVKIQGLIAGQAVLVGLVELCDLFCEVVVRAKRVIFMMLKLVFGAGNVGKYRFWI